jgi:hypothetical protein
MTNTSTTAIPFSALPQLGAELLGGTFAGITTSPTGEHAAVVLLADKPEQRMPWQQAMAWAQEAGGQLPSRPVAALLYANAKAQFEEAWYWTANSLEADTGDSSDASYAWYQGFNNGHQYHDHKGAEGRVRAVRLIQLTA